jgi:CRP-like cAMP-binding protein
MSSTLEPDFLRSFSLFSQCTPEELQILGGLLVPRQFSGGDVICQQGEAGCSCYLLVQGNVAVYKDIPSRGRIHMSPLRPGALFGQVSLLDGLPRMTTCIADGVAQVLELGGEPFQKLVHGRSRFAINFQREIARALVRQLRMANHRLGELEDEPESAQRAGLETVLNRMSVS